MSEGTVFIYRAPAHLLSHIEWTLAGISGQPAVIRWVANDEPKTTFRSAVAFFGPLDAYATLASAFMNLKQLTFEVLMHPAAGRSGSRWSFTPELGMFHCATDEAGNIVVGENRIRLAMEVAGSNALKLQAELRKILGQAFDDELEPLRELVGGAESNHGVVSTEAERVAYSQNVRPL
jgi:hypothetical protein